MKTRVLKGNIIKTVAAVFTCLIVWLALFVLLGCSKKAGISFTVNEINIFVGDSRDLAPYALFEPAAAKDKSFTLSVDGDCVRADGTIVKGVSPGSATVTANAAGGSASLRVNVKYRSPDNLDIEVTGELIQNLTDIKYVRPIKLVASYDDYAHPELDVSWTVDGEEAGSGKSFTLEPSRYGEYKIVCECEGLTSSLTARIYRSSDAHGEYIGSLEQTEGSKLITFTAYESFDKFNPRSVYRWTVDGKTACEQGVFEYMPEQGTHTVELYVNGERRKIDGKDSAVVNVSGKRAPACRVKPSADGVFVVWDDGLPVSGVYITTPTGVRELYESSDFGCAHLFGNGSFNATEYIAPCLDTEGEYRVSLLAGGRGEECSFFVYPQEVSAFLENVLICDRFLCDEYEADDFITEAYLTNARVASCYLSRETDVQKAVERTAAAAEMLGLIASVELDDQSHIMTVSFEEYSSVPAFVDNGFALQIYSELPHVELMNSKNTRGSSYYLPIERIKATASVSTSEQLAYIAQKGIRPVPQKGSNAEFIYSIAKRVLLGIIGKDYSNEQKVHAMCDWLQWTVSHARGEGGGTADFLEGVFGAPDQLDCGVASPLGYAKALALMCAMEGIECVTQTMMTPDGLYMWNKVKLDGMWYNVDAYAGDSPTEYGTELGSHDALFMTDEKARDYGLEPYGPLCIDGQLCAYYTNQMYGDICVIKYVGEKELADKKYISALINACFTGQKREPVSIISSYGYSNMTRDNFGLQIELGIDYREAYEVIKEAVRDYVSENFNVKRDNINVVFYTDGYVLQVITSIPRTQAAEGAVNE